MANLCEISGCRAACCHDMELEWSDQQPDPKIFFPDAIYINNGEERLIDGVYILKSNKTSVLIFGKCPNLVDSNCTLYNNRPSVCKRLAIFSPNCMEARDRDGFHEINKEVYRYSAD
jgi:hypothetical protein